MADNKKLQYGTISGPPKKPNEPETETVTANPPGRRPPNARPNVIGDIEYVVAPESGASATNPPGGTKTPTETETGSAGKQPPPTNVIHNVEYVVTPQPEPEPIGHLAQESKPTKTKNEEPAPQYSPEDTKRVEGWEKVVEQLPPGPQKAMAQDLASKARQQAKENQETKYGPVPEKDLPEISKMYGEFKKFYYSAFADYVNHAKQQGLTEAAIAQGAQVSAMQMGMSSLVDLHQGLNLASWHFFFQTLGPLGLMMFGPVGLLGMPLSTLLEKMHYGEIDFNLKYYGGRAWWSPYRLDYLIKTLPEEKGVEFLYNAAMRSIYVIGRATGGNFVSKAYDEFGRPLRGKYGYVFTPLVKLQQKANVAGSFLEALGTEGSVLVEKNNLDRLASQYAYINRFGKNLSESSKEKQLRDLSKLMRQQSGNIKIAENSVNKQWFGWMRDLNSNDPLKRAQALDLLRARAFRTIFGNTGKRLRDTHHDPLTWFALLVGGFIYDLTVGNLVRIIAEKIGSIEAWQNFTASFHEFFNTPLMQNLKASLGVGREFVGALPSLNTAAGGYVGYNVGGAIGQNIASALGLSPLAGFQIGSTTGLIVGGATGWGYQWALNLAKNPNLAIRFDSLGNPHNFFELTKEINTKIQLREFAIKQFGESSFSGQFLDGEIKQLTVKNGLFSTGLGAPGPMMRFANWLNSPVGRFFRIPIKGLAVSQFLSPFEAQIQQYLPWYQGWMPPVAQYLWEIKGAVWDVAFKPTLGRFWEFSKFSSGEWGLRPSDLHLTATGEVPGYRGLWKTNIPGKYLLDVSEAEGGGFRAIQPRGWYQQYINFRTGLNEFFGQQSALQKGLYNFFEGHPTLTRFVKGLGRVGLTNFAGFIIGFEVVSLLTGGNLIAAFLGGAVGFFTANLVLETIGTLLGKFGINFVPLFNTGFWLTTIVQTILGFMGYTLPNIWLIPSALWAPVVGGFLFAFSPWLLANLIAPAIGFFVPAVGTFIGGLAAGLGASLLGLTPLLVVGGVVLVAAMAIFSIIIIGSAFWVPISENLKGLTATSPCFDISSPSFIDKNGNSSNSIFTNGEEKTVCWITTNKQNFYQDAILHEKTFYPWENFQLQKYVVTINVPGKNPIVWDNTTTGTPEGFGLVKEYIPEPSSGQNTGYRFKITPPKDTAKAQEYEAKQIKSIYDQLNNKTNPVTKDELITEAALPTIIAQANSGFLQGAELDYLNNYINNPQAAINSEAGILNNLKTANTSNYIIAHAAINPLPGDDAIKSALHNVVYKCSQWQQTINTSPSPSPLPIAPYSSCDTLMKSLGDINSSGPGGNSPYQQMQDFFNEVKGSPASALLLKKEDLSNRPSQLAKNIQSLNSYPSYIDNIKNINPSLTGTALDDEINKLAGKTVENQGNFYLPAGSTIQICLTLKYTGENGKVGSVAEKDAATLPILGPLGVPSCQARLITPINAAGPGNLQWPTDQRSISNKGGYDPSPNGHKGIDIAGTAGTPAKAASSGTIIKEGTDPASRDKDGVLLSLGHYIIMQGDDGNYYLYGHLGDNVAEHGEGAAFIKKVGEKVNAGEGIGYIGNSGITNGVTGVHLHFGVSTTASGVGASDFYNNSTTTLNPCGFFQGGCP